MMKQRELGGKTSLRQSPVDSSKRNTRSRLRHPKIAIAKKHRDKLRAFSIHSDLDDNLSIFSREYNECDSPIKPLDNESFF